MSNKLDLKITATFAVLGAVAFCIPVYFFIREATFTKTWLLYLGVFLFLIVTIIHTFRDSRRRGSSERTFTLVFDSHIITICAIVLSCLLCFLMLVVFVPGYLSSGPAEKVLTDTNPTNIADKTNGLSLKIFMAAVIGNFSVGSFTGILLPFYSSRRRRGVSGEQFPLKQRGTSVMNR